MAVILKYKNYLFPRTDDGNPEHWYPSDLTWAQSNLYIGQPVDAAASSVMEWNVALDDQWGPNLAQTVYGDRVRTGSTAGARHAEVY